MSQAQATKRMHNASTVVQDGNTEWDYYRQQREWELAFSTPSQLTASALEAHEGLPPEPDVPPDASVPPAVASSASGAPTQLDPQADAAVASTAASAANVRDEPPLPRPSGKGNVQDEAEAVSDAPKFRRRAVGMSQTSRLHERHRPLAGRQGTSRHTRSKWVPPTVGWDASPARAVPYTLRGTRPVTDEPWARDEAINRNAEMEGIQSKAAGKRAGKKKAALSMDSRPAWDSSKTPYY